MKKNKKGLSFLALLLAMLLLLGVGSDHDTGKVLAKSSSELEKELEELENENKELDKEIEELQGMINDTMSEMQRLMAEKEIIDQKISMLMEQEKNVNNQISAMNLLIAEKQTDLDEAQKHLQDMQEQYKERIRAMEENGQLSYWSVLFNATSFFEMLDQLEMVLEIEEADRRCLQDLKLAAQQVEQAKAELETQQKALHGKRAELEQLLVDIEQSRAEVEDLIIQIEARGDEYLEMMENSEALQEELMEEMANLKDDIKEAKYKEWLATSRPHGGTGGTVGGTTGNITWLVPCTYSRISDTFGVREYHPVTGQPNKMHNGIDLAGAKNTPIVATRDGYVAVASYQHGGAGFYVSLNHGDGYRSIYMHMTKYIVKPGQYVQAGQVIGYMGSTGGSTGVHLHFGISYNGVYIDPQSVINFK